MTAVRQNDRGARGAPSQVSSPGALLTEHQAVT